MRDQGSVAREEAPGSPEEPPGRPAHLGPDAATLGRVLYAMRFSAVRVVTLAGVAPWSLRVDQEGASLLYLVRRGGAFLRFASEPTPQLLEPGDLAVLPLGRRHVLGEGGGAPDDLQVLLDAVPPPARGRSGSGSVPRLVLGGEGLPPGGRARRPDTEVLVALLTLEGSRERALFALLPGLIVMDADARAARPAVQGALDLALDELATDGPLTPLVLSRLFDVLVMKALETYLERRHKENPSTGTDWMQGLDDRQIAGSLVAMHQRPEAPWTVASLASEVGMSRSVFADRFQTLVGEPPLSYLTRFWIERAGTAIRRGAGIAEAAMAVGYRSEAAFARAFRREHGESPSAWRRQQAQRQAPSPQEAAPPAELLAHARGEPEPRR